jgi:FKBP-type peptidyl-prolyl cis-trans isomerase
VTRMLMILVVLWALTPGLALAQVPAPAATQDPPIPADTAVQTTASGLKYSILKPGDPKGIHPKLGDTVKVHYTGWLENGKSFDSSVKRGQPAEFRLGQVIKGWNEGLALMTPGARFKFTIPGDLAYGPRGQPRAGIGPNATLIFEVELLGITPGPALPVFQKPDPEAQKTLESGLKYEVLKEGTGDALTPDQLFEISWALWTDKGELVTCSTVNGVNLFGRTSKLQLAVLKEGASLLKPGTRCRFEAPPKLAFGTDPNAPVPPDTTTVWEMELVRVIEPPAFSLTPDDKAKTTDSGLKYEVLKEGTGKSPKMGMPVLVHYAGWLTNGKQFDSSFDRGQPARFPLGRVIPGWNEGLQLMKEGSVYKFTIPGKLAYGEQGQPRAGIGANQTLVFYVELIKVGN